jgi:spore maturation protein CgeB
VDWQISNIGSCRRNGTFEGSREERMHRLSVKLEGDREAVFFSSLEDCADKCRFYLDRPELREAIARRGRERAVRSGYGNDTQLPKILNRLDGAAQSAGSER